MDGAFKFGNETSKVKDSADGSVRFTTDEGSELTGINDFAGEVSGVVERVGLNGKEFGTNDGSVTVRSDGLNITGIAGIKSGDSIGGDLDRARFTMPEGRMTINGGEFTLEDDADGAAAVGGKVFTGLAKDASLTVGLDGSYRVNGGGGRTESGGVFTVNRDGGYLINPEHLPIIEKTPGNVVRQRGGNGLALIERNSTIGAGYDSVIVRNEAEVTVDTSGEPLIVATSGQVTLENYGEGNASVGTFEYTNIAGAIKRNAITFGDGVMTLGDAVITFDAGAGNIGGTQAQLVNARGDNQAIGFTHTAGGTINANNETAAQIIKGNYADKSSDTQKSGGSEIIGGEGNDTLLIGAGDTADGGLGNDLIFVTDGAWRELGAQIIMSAGSDTVTNFNGGYATAGDEILIGDLNAITFEAGASELIMKSGANTLTFKNMAKNSDSSYRLKLNDGRTAYNAAITQRGKNISVVQGDLANVFYGDGSGINFSEYTGAVAVNLTTGTGTVGNQSAQFRGFNKLQGGAGASTLTGANDVANTLMAGTGDGLLWSNSGNDLMIGQRNKTGSTTFRFLAEDGRDTIQGFDFATSADSAGDLIDITTANEVTSVSLRGNDVILTINNSATDYLTLARGKGNDFRINNLVAKVDDRQLAFDGLANCYVADGTNATLKVGSEIDSGQIWLNDMGGGLHGTYYLGDIKVVDASKSAGTLILTGNDLNNTIIGGDGVNSIWGGYGYDNDVLIGGNGQNTFFFAMVNGNDVIQNAHDGDVIDLGTLTTDDIAGTIINESGAAVGLKDGSLLEVRSNAAVEYKLADGTYAADHASGQWVKKQ